MGTPFPWMTKVWIPEIIYTAFSWHPRCPLRKRPQVCNPYHFEVTLSSGGLIALFERAVGLYASLVGINAYHQPGVKPARKQPRPFFQSWAVIDHLKINQGNAQTAGQVAETIGQPEKTTGSSRFLKVWQSINLIPAKNFNESPLRINFSPVNPIHLPAF